MDKFAFLSHPYDLDVFASRVIVEPALKIKNRRLVERAFRWLPPIIRDTIVIKSGLGHKAEGLIIVIPLISEQVLHMDEKFVLKKTLEAGRLAQRLGAKIIGLGAYLAYVGRRGVLISESLEIPVTTGTSYTIAIAIEATLRAAKAIGIEISKAKVTIVGATGSIGKVCANILASQVASLNLVARNLDKLKALTDYIHTNYGQLRVQFTSDIKKAIKTSDIIVVSTNTPSAIISVKDLPAGCVVCDISVPHNISAEDAQRSDVLVIDGGLVRCPREVNLPYLALPRGLAYACLAETMILTLEGMYENYSIGGNISVDRVLKINQLASKHGFDIAEFRSFGKPVSNEQIAKIREARLKR